MRSISKKDTIELLDEHKAFAPDFSVFQMMEGKCAIIRVHKEGETIEHEFQTMNEYVDLLKLYNIRKSIHKGEIYPFDDISKIEIVFNRDISDKKIKGCIPCYLPDIFNSEHLRYSEKMFTIFIYIKGIYWGFQEKKVVCYRLLEHA